MKIRNQRMPALRLAYVALFLLALIAVFTLWSQVAGQGHLDLISWYWKLGFGLGAAYATVKAAAAAVAEKEAWNVRSLRWFIVVLAMLTGCALTAWYAHVYYEDDEGDGSDEEPAKAVACSPRPYISARFESARRLDRSAPTSATTMRSRS